MGALTGTGTLIRFTVRRDRVRIALWVVAIVALVWITAVSTQGLYPTTEDLRAAAVAMEDNPATLVFNGPAQNLESLGGRIAFETATFAYIVTALMSIFMIGRLTRAEEESGRVELLRATVVGRDAPLAAALAVVAAMNVAVALGVVLAELAVGLPVGGSVLFGVCFLAVGLAFAGVATVTAQVTENTRIAYGLAGAVLGLAFALRAAGDVGDGTLSWASPIGWAQKARPYAGDRWWPLLLLAALAAATLALALTLVGRRDVGGGLVPPGPGPAHASPALGRPLGLATRLQRGSVIWWSVGVAALGTAYGAVGDDLEDFIGDNESLEDIFVGAGVGSVTDAFFATTLGLLALIAAGFAVQSTLRLRSEESALRAEPLLATPVSRWRWMASHLAIAFAGSAAVVVAGSLGVGLTYAAVVGDLGEIPRLAAASVVHVPAVWVLVGLATALFGLAPRATPVAWAAVTACFVVGFLGGVLDLPGWVLDLSPFEHTPSVPGGDLELAPLIALLAVALALTAAGVRGFQHRDLG